MTRLRAGPDPRLRHRGGGERPRRRDPGRPGQRDRGRQRLRKSTLLRGLARLLPPRDGAVYLDGTTLAELRTLDIAKVLGLLPQSPVAPDGITVAGLVSRGRYPHQGWF